MREILGPPRLQTIEVIVGRHVKRFACPFARISLPFRPPVGILKRHAKIRGFTDAGGRREARWITMRHEEII